MKLNKFLILITISIILTLVMVILIRERQYLDKLIYYNEVEIQQEETRLKLSQELIKEYNELQLNYNKLLIDYNELIEDNEWQLFTCTGYSANDLKQGTNNIIATTFDLNYTRTQNLPIVASNCIPLYSIIEIEGLGGFIVLDNGLGYRTEYDWEDENWIDILFDNKEEANKFGIRDCLVRVISINN